MRKKAWLGLIGLLPLTVGLADCGKDDRADESVSVVKVCTLEALGTTPPDQTVRTFVSAARAFRDAAPQVESAFKDACNAIGKDLGLPPQGAAVSACKPISAAIEKVIHLPGEPPPGPRPATWGYVAFSGVCKSDVQKKAACVSACSGKPCDVTASCEKGKLAGKCDGACMGTCQTNGPAVACSGSCTGACTVDAKSCGNECVGKCAPPPASFLGSCSGACAANFKGVCGGTCTGKCDGAPIGMMTGDAGPGEAGTDGGSEAGADGGSEAGTDGGDDGMSADAMDATSADAPAMDGSPAGDGGDGGGPPIPGGADGNCTGLCEGVCSSQAGGSCSSGCMGAFSSGICNGNCTGTCNTGGGGGCVGTCAGACVQKSAGTCDGICRGACSTPFANPICEGRLACDANIQCTNACEAQAALDATCTPGGSLELRMIGSPALYAAIHKNAALLEIAFQRLSQLRAADGFITSRSQGDFAAIGAGGENVRACVDEGVADMQLGEESLRIALTASVSLRGS